MKIVIVSGSLPAVHCGIGEYAARLASALARVPSVDVAILTTRSHLVRPDAPAPAQVLAPVRGWGLISVIRSVLRIRRLRPDVVHVQYPAVGYARTLGILALPLMARLLARVPVVLTVHERRERGWHGRLATDFMALTSNRVIVPDPIEAQDMRRRLERFGTRVDVAEMISTVPVKADVDRRAIRARLGLSDDEILVGTFGLIHPRRRLEDVVDALAALHRRSIASHLVIIGGAAEYDARVARDYIARIKSRIAGLGLSGHVTWPGYVAASEVSETLQTCDACVLLYPQGASRRNTTLETAVEHRIPVVTTDGPATSDSLRVAPNLYFVAAGTYTPDELAERILTAARTGWKSSAPAPAGSPLSRQADWHLAIYRQLVGARST